jgi:uncharacterized membrane protein
MLNKLMRGIVAALALAGMVVSILALQVHNMDPGLAPPCAVDEHWDCGAVNHSPYAVFPPHWSFDDEPGKKPFNIPVAAIGIVGYAVMAVLAIFGRLWIVLQLAEIGFGCACMLTYLEAYVIKKWCIYCVWSQGIVTVLLLATIVALVVRWRTTKLVVSAA